MPSTHTPHQALLESRYILPDTAVAPGGEGKGRGGGGGSSKAQPRKEQRESRIKQTPTEWKGECLCDRLSAAQVFYFFSEATVNTGVCAFTPGAQQSPRDNIPQSMPFLSYRRCFSLSICAFCYGTWTFASNHQFTCLPVAVILSL